MISPDFVLLAVVISFVGVSFYARDTVRGLTEPNRVTWLLWTVAPLLAFISEVRQGVGMTSLMTLAYALCPLVVLVASFVNTRSTWKLGPFDIGCGLASCGGLVLWLVTANDTVALFSFIVADLLAGLPTVLKSWRDPSTESPSAFLGGTLSTIVTLATVTTWTSAEVAFPVFVLAFNVVLLTLVAGRIGPRLRREPAPEALAPVERVLGRVHSEVPDA